MDLFVGFFVFVFLMFLASALYLTVLQEIHKVNKGISVEYGSAQEIYEILAEKLKCPFLEEVRINEKQKIVFQCKYGVHTGKLEDGKFCIDGLARKFSSHREVEEAWYLQKYVEGVFCPEHMDGEILEQRFAKYIKIFNASRIIKYAVFVCVAIFAFRLFGGMDSIKSKGVSQMCYTEYSNEITIGEALDATFTKGKWSNNKIRDDLYHVTYSGYGADGSLLTVLFQTDGEECSIKSIMIDGEDCTLISGLFLETIYENAKNGGKGDADISRESIESGMSGTNAGEQGFLETLSETEPDLSEQSNEPAPDDEEIENENAASEEIINDGGYDDDFEADDAIPAWELTGHYGGIIGAQSVMEISMYTEDSEDGSIGVADIYVEGGEYSYRAELYEVSTNLYWAAVDTDEEVVLSAYRDGEDIIMQLYVDGECITEYLLEYRFFS